MPSYNRNALPPGGTDMGSTIENRGFFNKILRRLSNYNMNIDDMVAQNSYAIGVHDSPDPLFSSDPATQMYDIFTRRVISKLLDRKSIAALDRAYEDKRKILRQYSIKDRISSFITEIADEMVIYDEDNLFCSLNDLPKEFQSTIRQRYKENFLKIYNSFGFNDGLTAWNYCRNFLIDGFIAYEIVYDNKQKNIIELRVLDPITLVPATDPGTNTLVWIQNPENPQNRRVLLNSQIIYISYSNNNEYAETSYVEGLIKPYNQLVLLEQARQLYNLNQASIYRKFIIPTDGLTKQQAQQQIHELVAAYHEDVQWDDTMGTITINGSPHIQHSKDIWFPSQGGNSPTFEVTRPESTDLNDDIMLNWFYKNLKRATKIPFGRFDEESGGGNLYSDAAEITRDEIKFNHFIKRLRTVFKEIIIKPLRIQMVLDFPELEEDNQFNSSIQVIFNSDAYFEEWKYLRNLEKRSSIASVLNQNLTDKEGNPWIPIAWQLRKIMKFSEEEIAEMERYKKLESSEVGTAQGGAGEMGGGEFGGEFGGGGGGEFGGEGGEFGGEEGGEGGEFGGEMGAQGGEGAQGGPQGGGGAQPEF